MQPASCRCSTPFGITEFAHESAWPYRRMAIWCSTPFGITEFGTAGGSHGHRASSSAQRLSASLNSAPLGIVDIRADRSAQRLSASLNSAQLAPKLLWSQRLNITSFHAALRSSGARQRLVDVAELIGSQVTTPSAPTCACDIIQASLELSKSCNLPVAGQLRAILCRVPPRHA